MWTSFDQPNRHPQDATHLNRRPFLHCSNIPFIVLIVFILCANLRTFRLNIWLAMVLTALTSHHIRDATRRGFWIRPYGDTPPLPYVVYVALTVALPFAVIGLVNVFHTKWSTVKEQYRERLLDVWINVAGVNCSPRQRQSVQYSFYCLLPVVVYSTRSHRPTANIYNGFCLFSCSLTISLNCTILWFVVRFFLYKCLVARCVLLMYDFASAC